MTVNLSPDLNLFKCWPFNGFAPGGYRSICKNCGKPFIGDKRATSCLPCAVNEAKFRTIEVGTPLSMGVFTKDAPVEIVFAPNGGCILRQTLGLGYVANVLGAYFSVADMLGRGG